MRGNKFKAIQTAYHSNGVAGVPYHVVTFTVEVNGKTLHKVGIIWVDTPDHIAVLDIDKLVKDDVSSPKLISDWGPHYEGDIRAIITGSASAANRSAASRQRETTRRRDKARTKKVAKETLDQALIKAGKRPAPNKGVPHIKSLAFKKRQATLKGKKK